MQPTTLGFAYGLRDYAHHALTIQNINELVTVLSVCEQVRDVKLENTAAAATAERHRGRKNATLRIITQLKKTSPIETSRGRLSPPGQHDYAQSLKTTRCCTPQKAHWLFGRQTLVCIR